MIRSLSRLYVVPLLTKKHAFPIPDGFRFSAKVGKTVLMDDPRITLIGIDEKVSILNLSEAHDLSKSQNLKLIKVTNLDVKTRRPLYKLLSTEAYKEEQLKLRNQKKEAKKELTIKGEKLMIFSSRIAEHDFLTRCNKINRWLEKRYDVKITVNGNNSLEKSEIMFNNIVKECGDLGKVKQKSTANCDIKFHLHPKPKVEPEPVSDGIQSTINGTKVSSQPPPNENEILLNHQQKREMHTNSGDERKL